MLQIFLRCIVSKTAVISNIGPASPVGAAGVVRPHLGQSLCCTSSCTACSSSSFASAILSWTKAAARTSKAMLPERRGVRGAERPFPQRYQDGDCQVTSGPIAQQTATSALHNPPQQTPRASMATRREQGPLRSLPQVVGLTPRWWRGCERVFFCKSKPKAIKVVLPGTGSL
jgi:hypothetical protein